MYIWTIWHDPSSFSPSQSLQVIILDAQLTEIMLVGEHKGARKIHQWQQWVSLSAQDCLVILILETEVQNASKETVSLDSTWLSYVSSLIFLISITKIESDFIYSKIKQCRSAWKSCKKQLATLRKRFLVDCAELMASKLHIMEEKAFKAWRV